MDRHQSELWIQDVEVGERENGSQDSDRPLLANRTVPSLGEIRRAGVQAEAHSPATNGVVAQPLGFSQYVRPLLRWWWLIVISAVVGAVSGYIGASQTPRMYQSRTTLMVGQALQNPNPDTSQLYTGQVLAQSYADLAKREPVLVRTLAALGLPWNWTVLQAMVSSRVVPGTQLIEITVLDNDPQRVVVLTHEIAQQLILQSPSATDPERDAETQFIQSEIDQLKTNIQQSRLEVSQLNDVIAKSNSAREIQTAQARQTTLQTQITTWEATYAQLLTNLSKGTPNYLSIVEPAQAPVAPVSPGTGTNVLLGLAMGLVLSGSAAFLLEYIDDTIKTEEDVRQTLGMVTLGRLPRLGRADRSSKLVIAGQPRSLAAGAYRVLRTNLQFCSIDRPLSTLMVTSAGPKEGKSITAANLAAAIAQAGQNVILVDADLWHPVQHTLFELNFTSGLTDILRDDANLPGALQTVPIEHLRILPAGPLPPNPADLLGSQRMRQLIESLREQADVVIFDSSPVEVDADAVILAAHVDGVVMVVDSGGTRRAQARRAKEALEAVGANLVGAALNRVRARGQSYSYYYRAYGQQQRHSSRQPSTKAPE